MGQIVIPDGAVVGIDANTLIYHVEHYVPYDQISLPLWQMFDARHATIITSELTYLEALIKPMRIKDNQLVEQYREIAFDTFGFYMMPITFAVLKKAIDLRVNHNLKSPDAIQAATAILYRCNVFVTNDPIFKRVPGLNVVVLKELVEQE